MAPKKRKAEVDHGSRKVNTTDLFTWSRFTDSNQKNATETPTTRRITRGMTTDAARRAVFETAELLENIFIQLPPRKIFVIQRVCKQFRDVVASSVKLQQRLFLRSDGTEAQAWRVAAKENADAPNSDWLRTFRFVKTTYTAGADEDLGVAFKPVRIGHALERAFRTSEPHPSRGFYSAYLLVDFRRKIDYFGESSLVKTYLTHPPAQQATVNLTLSLKSDSHMEYSGSIKVSKPDGLKVADVLHAIRYSRFYYIRRHRSATQEAETFADVSLQDVTGDEKLFDKNNVNLKSASMDLPGCIEPTEKEWAEMAG
ncbi:hypothetical protein KC360_g8708 [Hortaea werneckii]|nr:hypothetical protein KC361_g9190 [Hortaea werneckii]KAI6877941.1 hypothetical protein KC325_g8936 [Hortaea werneckii]KAI6998152.1 hypothetical protein KC359_g2574 [Hortaea werneckii]KAI7142161.1 hypothetical protein KC344_g7444 [Hortaea werneckii]KAI7167352.1 hypothetical protein KC360_g8708 [Hortaea werneckii]